MSVALGGEGGTPPGSPTRAAPAIPSSSSQKPSASASGQHASPTKRRYVPDSHDLETVKRIKESEIELKDRVTVLRGVKPNVRCAAFSNNNLNTDSSDRTLRTSERLGLIG